MYVYRICRAAQRALDGEGARLYGGRWNSPGRPVVYTSTSLALAALEYLIHVDPEDVPPDLIALTIEIPDDIDAETADAAALPAGWEQVPEPPACKAIGEAWANAGRVLALRVPAAPVPEEMNLLLNPRHSGASRVRIANERPFFYDPRLLA
ncbi:MAG: RES family NAD+ phosphorylase [Gemmatimonadales bacterium]